MESRLLWQPAPDAIAASNMGRFQKSIEQKLGQNFASYSDFHRWSCDSAENFWTAWLAASGILHSGSPTPARRPKTSSAESRGGQFFPNLTLNFAENLLRFRDERPAILSVSESRPPVALTYSELAAAVAQARAGLLSLGVGLGDRVAGFLPNCAEALIAMLASASLGALWTSCSPDFGVQGVLDRFGQIKPKVLLAANAYIYAGKTFSCREKITAIAQGIPGLDTVVLVPFVQSQAMPAELPQPGPRAMAWSEFLQPEVPLAFAALPFNHPLYVMYSSGTTGKPKCIVHGAGGTLLQHSKELLLHCDLRRDDSIMYFTTCGWMMWNWLVSALFAGARVVLYDGSPAHPNVGRLWQLVADEGITHFGTSPKFIGSCRDKIVPKDAFQLKRLRMILSTGSPLLPEDFEWIYANAGSQVQLASISGGTDIISCFMLGNPTLPVYRGEIQAFGLGMDVVAMDDHQQAVLNRKGELVCRNAFPSMPIYFWDDPDHGRYNDAYFRANSDYWFHGDYIEVTGTVGQAGGVVVYGRSDATLNPGGVRIGTAEIYRLVEVLPEVADSLVVGQPHEGDERVVLFVKLAEGLQLDAELVKTIKSTIRAGATPRHVPAVVLSVTDIPYTISGKKVELAVRQVICGQEPKNKDALANPQALDEYRSRPELVS